MAAEHPANPSQQLRDTSSPARPSRRSWLLLGLVALLIALVILPPFLSVSRFQRRIVTSMSQTLGRPVHLNHVTLHLLPFPAFTIDNLVIDELPPFGDEPIIRANSVSARLRLSSLWRRRVEFSRITFTEPSINLVRNPNGRWNLESFLLQAAHINAAPTAQPRASSAPRFPYIEATGARINLKLAQRKTPYSLTEAELALWLPEPQQWKLRLRGRPARTDTGATDTGLLQTEATLERASSVGDVPLTLDASWTDAPLGEASRVLTGADAGLRGTLLLTTHIAGTLDHAALQLELKLNGMHRADFVPDQPIDVDLTCRATATHLLHTLSDLGCRWPLSSGSSLLRTTPSKAQFTLAGSIPDLLTPATSELTLAAEHVPASTLLIWARATTGRLALGLHISGELNGAADWAGSTTPASARFALTQLTLSGGRLGTTPITFAPLVFTGSVPHPGTLAGAALSLPPTALFFGRNLLPRNAGDAASAAPDSSARGAADSDSPQSITPMTDDAASNDTSGNGSPNGATEDSGSAPPAITSTADAPAGAVLSGSLTTTGYAARINGLIPLPRLLALGADIPSFGAGLQDVLPNNRASGPTRIDLTVHRLWGQLPVWSDNHTVDLSPAAPAKPRTKPRHRR